MNKIVRNLSTISIIRIITIIRIRVCVLGFFCFNQKYVNFVIISVHTHSHPHYLQQNLQHDSNLIYNNSSTNSDCNHPLSTNDSSQSGCSNVIHYIPTSNLSVNSQSLNIPNVTCDCGSNCQPHQPIHQRQQSLEQQSQSGRSSRIVSCDENNPSGTEDGSGTSSGGMISAQRRASKRILLVIYSKKIFFFFKRLQLKFLLNKIKSSRSLLINIP